MQRHLMVASAFSSISERIERFFSTRGYQVDVVRGGVECLRGVRRMAPDLLILDWDLPWGGGAGVLACLHDAEATKTIPVIVLMEGSLKETSVAVPVARCLQLPCGVNSLCRTVESVLASTARTFPFATAIDRATKLQRSCR